MASQPDQAKGKARELSSRGWFGKVSAAVVLGFTLSLALTCTFSALFSTGDAYFSAQGQMALWLMSPTWCLILSFCFLFRRSEEHKSELPSLMRSSYAVFCLKK